MSGGVGSSSFFAGWLATCTAVLVKSKEGAVGAS